ncbi:branched-chain amino acid transport system / permease component family protein [Anoxybacillus sp. B7M1]|jgi:branched-chain amino acid transport system permease protein|uniref:Branched-chain amino acid ABC transporter permease n=1 Tax=Anoxybacteroides rupiense TaxID=311460 RepID=A0ABD5IVY7_9BACL|nr:MULTISPECIES: branched-chain amino acid ABC transporter permease [Anoxybacillus]ANB59016.1 branched-chain amino acid transport system / permease component family protein [Anoxybacillus sp. B2M1]ANB64240.1 branched-chain amino acid transport system / permease component family protein [Anoxybacillus sp. B7M1]KXG08591.1 High-affinity branched-chain amino acid transport system permease protein LivH [Anoxybacillus sp. P3H1B]MBB3908224.1 branched-chain amino acid transport system permease protein 
MIEQVLHTLPQVLIDGLALGAVYAIVALGYTMVYGILELINFAHGEIFMTGAFVGTAILLTFSGLGWITSMPAIITLVLVLIVTSVLTGLLGMGIERVAYRPLRNAPKLITLITAIGISFLLQDLVRFITELKNGNYILTGPNLFNKQIGIEASSILSVFNDASVKSSFFIVLGVAIVMMITLDFFVNRTKWGMAMRAVAQDRETAALMTVNVNKVIALTFFIGSALGGATGVLFAVQYGTIDPYIGFILGLKAFTAAVLGGIGNIRGAMFGGILIGLLEMFAAANLPIVSHGVLGAEYKDVFAFAILIIVLIFKPEGLFGKVTVEKV